MFVNLSELFLVWASVSRLWLSKHRKGGAGATIDVTVEVGAVDDITVVNSRAISKQMAVTVSSEPTGLRQMGNR